MTGKSGSYCKTALNQSSFQFRRAFALIYQKYCDVSLLLEYLMSGIWSANGCIVHWLDPTCPKANEGSECAAPVTQKVQ